MLCYLIRNVVTFIKQLCGNVVDNVLISGRIIGKELYFKIGAEIISNRKLLLLTLGSII